MPAAAPPLAVAVPYERIGELLVREGQVTRDQLANAQREQKQSGTGVDVQPGQARLHPGNRAHQDAGPAVQMPAVDLSKFEVDPKIAKLIPDELATKNLVLPLKRDGRTLTVAMADPTNFGVIDDLKFITRYDIFPVIAGEFTLRNTIEKYYESSDVADAVAPRRDRREDGRARGRRERRKTSAERRRARRADRRGAGRQADQRDPHRRREARRVATSTSNASSTSSACATASTARCRKS